MRLRAVVPVLIVGLAGALPSAASATQRFASATGSGTACDQASPCFIDVAINSAADGDEVIVSSGDYGTSASPVSTTINSAKAIDVHGVAGQPRPRLFSSAGFALQLTNTSSKLSRVEVDSSNPGFVGAVRFGGASLDDVIGIGTGAQTRGCEIFGTTVIRNTVCATATGDLGLVASGALAPNVNVTLRNVTAYTGSTSASSGGLVVASASTRPTSVTATNSIFIGGTSDVRLLAQSAPATATIDHSDFSSNSVLESGGGVATLNDAGANVAAEPLLANPAGFDFHEVGPLDTISAGSPTIDAGVTGADNGTTDIDGDQRTLNGATDIGADEFVPAPVVPAPVELTLDAKRKQHVKRLKVAAKCTIDCELDLSASGRAGGRKVHARPLSLDVEGAALDHINLDFSHRARKRLKGHVGRFTITALATDELGRTASGSVNVKLIPRR